MNVQRRLRSLLNGKQKRTFCILVFFIFIGALLETLGVSIILPLISMVVMPEDMMNRPKKGFSVPLTRWLTEGETAIWAEELMNDCTIARDGILDEKYVIKMWDRFKNKKEPSRFVWNILMLEQWYRENKAI